METAPPGGAGLGAYADSIDSLSPRSRGAESWDEPFAPAPAVAASKLRLMCSYGGQIVPRPHDRALCYLGGETRIMVVDRHSTLADLHSRLSRSLLGGRPFSIKYQLPSEDLDSLISVTTDEDLDNMIEEYDRIAAAAASPSSAGGGGGGKPARLRLFLFPAKPESAGPSSSSMGSLLDDSKSETWFVDALNSSMLGGGLNSADSASSSVNCLLGLDDSKPSPDGTGTGGGDDGGALPPESENEMAFPRRDSSGKLGGSSRRGGQDPQSAPESPMMGTISSFGSASSAPVLSNLPPIRVRPDDRGPDPRAMGAGLEEHFAQMQLSDLHQKQQQQQQQQVDVEGFNPDPPHLINAIPYGAAVATAANPTNISPTEKPNQTRVFTSDDDRSDHGDVQRSSPQLSQQQRQQLQQQQQQLLLLQQQQQLLQQQQRLNVHDLAFPGDAASRAVYYQERPPPASDPKQELPQYDPSFRLPLQFTEKGYLLQQSPAPPPPHVQAADLLQQQQQQTQQQYVQASPHLLHHHASGTVLPMNPYYQMPIHPQQQQQLPQAAPHPYNQQISMYSLPLRQNTAYSLPVQPTLGDAAVGAPIPSAAKPTVPLPSTVFPSAVAPPSKPELAGNIYRTGVGAAAPPPPVAQTVQPTQFIHLGDPPHQYVGYHSMPHPRPQSAAAAMPPAGYGYEYADVGHPQQVYYTQAAPAPLPHQYQAVSTGAVMAEVSPALQQTTDIKQAKAS